MSVDNGTIFIYNSAERNIQNRSQGLTVNPPKYLSMQYVSMQNISMQKH